MHFCSVCENMYYISIDEKTGNLKYYCRNCGNNDTNLTVETIMVSQNVLKKNEKQFNHIINKYTKLDPTLPRINNILCPNENCSTNKSNEPREIIYIRYDDINMKYVYLCSSCDTCWKVEDTK